MKFCTKCGSIWYLKKVGDSELKYVCRNCGYSEEKSEEGICVHSSRMNEDYQNYQMLNNKYIIQDPTLPRLNNVKCINSKCLTNRPNLFLVRNSHRVDQKKLMDALWAQVSDQVQVSGGASDNLTIRNLDSSEVTLYGEIHSPSEHLLINQEVELCDRLAILECKESEVSQTIQTLLQAQPNLLDTLGIEDTASSEPGTTPSLTEILREVIFIKYDDVNMKYMYICSTCGSSWKNIA